MDKALLLKIGFFALYCFVGAGVFFGGAYVGASLSCDAGGGYLSGLKCYDLEVVEVVEVHYPSTGASGYVYAPSFYNATGEDCRDTGVCDTNG